jgi:hypothetical protein
MSECAKLMLTKNEQMILKAMEDFHERHPFTARIHWSPNRANCVVTMTILDHHGLNLYLGFEIYVRYIEHKGYEYEKEFIRGELTIKRVADKKGLAIWTTGHHLTVGDALVEIREQWDRLWANPEMETKFTELMFLLED